MQRRFFKDKFFKVIMLIFILFSASIIFVMLLGLSIRSLPILKQKTLTEIFLSGVWHPMRGEFGFAPFIVGTLWVTMVAMIFAIPLCLLTAIYLSEYASPRISKLIKPFIDLLAGIPSVVYGIWGVLFIIPLIRDFIAPVFKVRSTGYGILAGGIVLGIMVFPIIIQICVEVFQSVPKELREASLALGATKWQTIKHSVIKKALPGIIAAIVLGFSRAFGETMAVLMVVGNVAKIPHSIFDCAYPLPALIANNYGEMLSIPLYDSALMLASLILLLLVLFFNIIARLILIRVERSV